MAAVIEVKTIPDPPLPTATALVLVYCPTWVDEATGCQCPPPAHTDQPSCFAWRAKVGCNCGPPLKHDTAEGCPTWATVVGCNCPPAHGQDNWSASPPADMTWDAYVQQCIDSTLVNRAVKLDRLPIDQAQIAAINAGIAARTAARHQELLAGPPPAAPAPAEPPPAEPPPPAEAPPAEAPA